MFKKSRGTAASDVSAWTCAWPWPVLKHRNEVLGLGPGLEGRVFGHGLGLVTLVLVNNTDCSKGFHNIRVTVNTKNFK